MLCVKCNKESDYLYGGNSLCTLHFHEARNNGFAARKEYEDLMQTYKGKPGCLDRYFNVLANIKNVEYLTSRFKANFIKEINNVMNRSKHDYTVVDKSLMIATNMGYDKNRFFGVLYSSCKEKPRPVLTIREQMNVQ